MSSPPSFNPDELASLRLDRDAAEARAHRQAAPWVFGGILAALAVAGALAWTLLRDTPEPVRTAIVEAPRTRAGAAEAGPVLSASGYVVARRISTPSAKITAQVKTVFIEEGMAVNEGDVLAMLDDATPRRQLALAESQLTAARRAVNEFEVRLDEARKTLTRNAALFEQNLVSESVLDASEADVHALEAKLAVTRSEVDVALRSVDLAAQAVDDTIIRAPFSGVVVSKDAQPGEMISPISAGGGFTRTGICTLVDMDSLEIEVDVNEAYINRVADGQRVEATLDAYPQWRIPAHVISIVPTADRQKATVRVRIGFDAKDPRILPDMGIQVQFMEAVQAPPTSGAAAPAHPAVPVQALVKQDDTDYVFVVRDGNAVERRAVRVGAIRGGTAQVLAGLRGGETVVLAPAPELADGDRVTIESDTGR